MKTLAQAEAGLVEDGVFATGASRGKAPRYASLVQGLGTLKRDGHLWRGAAVPTTGGATAFIRGPYDRPYDGLDLKCSFVESSYPPAT